MKNYKYLPLFLILALAISSCGKKEETGKAKKTKVAYVINGALGDQAFYDSGQIGMDRLAKDYDVQITTIENNFDPSRYPQSMEAVVKWGADVVFIIPYGYEDLLVDYVHKYTNIRFITIEPVVEAKNLLSIDFREDEGSFLAGVTAALMTTNTAIPRINADKIVGLVAGDDSPVVMEFVSGFKQGVEFIDKDIQIKTSFIGDWSDPIKGKQAANQLYAQKADVIFQVAALTGMGVLEAAKDANKYAIGVDINQNSIQPGFVPASMIKDVGEAIYSLFTKYKNGELQKDGIIELGVKDNIIYLAIDEYSEKILPAKEITIIEETAEKIKNGEIKVKK